MIGESVLRCPNGSRGHLISSQPAVDRHSPQIQTIDCSSFEKQSKTLLLGPSPPIQRIRAPSLLARQSTICSASCSTSCYTSNIQYNPQDCYDLSGWMWARAGQYPVKPLEKIVMTWRSCVYAFTNEQQESVTWCDSPWAKIGVDLVGPCQGANGGGGVCTGQGFRAEVLSSDNPTNSSTPYMSATSLATRTSSTRSQVPTEVPLPLIPSIFPSASGYGGEPNINVIPVLVGIIAAITLFLLAIMCYCVVWRRSRERGHILPSDDGHRTREETLTNSYPILADNHQRDHLYALAITITITITIPTASYFQDLYAISGRTRPFPSGAGTHGPCEGNGRRKSTSDELTRADATFHLYPRPRPLPRVTQGHLQTVRQE